MSSGTRAEPSQPDAPVTKTRMPNLHVCRSPSLQRMPRLYRPWITVQTVVSMLIEIKGYDVLHEEATAQAGPATGQCERGGAAPRPGTTTGGHRHTDRLSSRNALLPLLWPRRPGRVPAGRAPARRRRDNRARRHNRPATRRPAALSDNRARRVPRGAARSMRRPALLRGSHRTTRNPHGREGRDARRVTSKAPRRGRRHRPIHDQRLPRRCQRHPRGCTDRYAHPLGRWPRHTRSRVSAGTDRPTRQERHTRLNKRAPTGQRAGARRPTTDNRTSPPRLRDEEVAGSKPATPAWPLSQVKPRNLYAELQQLRTSTSGRSASPTAAALGVTRCDAPVYGADPVDDQAAVFLGCLLPREVTRVERMDLAAGEEVVEVLVVRPQHEVIVAPGPDLRRLGDGRQQVTQYRVLLGVMPHEPGRLREPPEVVGADIVLVDVGLGVARGTRLDRVADVGPGVQPAHDVQTRRLDDVLERTARFDRKADRAAADGQAHNAFRRPGGNEERRGRADVRADDVRSSQAPLVDQTRQERTRGVRGNQFRATIGVAESR